MTKQYWTKAHAYYSQQEWIKKPSMFAEFAIQHFPKKGKVLDLGAGQGQDSRFFAERGYEVVSTDYEKFALGVNESNIPPELKEKIEVKEIDLLEELPFHNREFDIVYSHLSLHYFNSATTKKIFDEIGRILKTDGIIALLVNSTEDPEYNTGTKIEEDYFEIEGLKKRFFNIEKTKMLTSNFEKIVLDNKGETYKDSALGIHNLIRYIGKKNDK